MDRDHYASTEYNIPLIENRADPYIFKHEDGTYYFTASVPEYDRIILRKAADISGLKYAEEKTLWVRHDSGPMSCHIWAPEIHYISGAWYIYFAAGEKDDIWKIRPYVLVNRGDPMEDEWQELGQMKAAETPEPDKFSFQDFSLDMTVFSYREKWYCVWAEKVNIGKKISNLYIAEMEAPDRLLTAQVLLSAPDYDWERRGFWVNEGAAVLERDGRLFLTYSASSTGADYCMGMLRLRRGGDPLDPSDWSKSREPVVKTDVEKGIFGPGHNSFVKSEDGLTDIMVFHARQYDEILGDPLYDENRHAYTLPVEWDENEEPVFHFRKNRRPNILMMVVDHQAFYGHPRVKTPYFDRLKAEGVFFERAYCSSPLSMPSRKTMMTGLYPHHHGQTDNSFETPWDSHETYVDVLKEAGYRNYYFGKWHACAGKPSDLGCLGVSYPDYSNPYHQPEYEEYRRRKELPPARMRVEMNMCEKGWIDNVKEGDLYDFPRDLTNEALSGILEGPKECHEAYYVADMACRQLEELKREEAPFMMRVDFWGPHQPYCPTEEFAALYPPESIEEYPSFSDDLAGKPKSYLFDTGRETSRDRELIRPNPMEWSRWQMLLSRCYGQITMVDEAVGSVIEKLRELQMDENTLIIWTADHGDALACHGGHFDKAFYLPEEVLRIPLAMACPGVLPKNRICRELVTNCDLAPTIVSAAGSAFRSPVDGEDIFRLFTEQRPGWRTALLAETYGHLAPWRAEAVVWQQYKYVDNHGDAEELYDLEADPYELHNLAKEKEYQALLMKMRMKLLELKPHIYKV